MPLAIYADFLREPSTVVEIDPETSAYSSLIDGLKTAIGVTQLPGSDSYLVLQHSSGPLPPFFGGPGVVLGYASPSSAPQVPGQLPGASPGDVVRCNDLTPAGTEVE